MAQGTLRDIEGPGVDGWLSDQLRLWGITHFTEVQHLGLAAGVAQGESVIVCAPTSSGKTLIGEIAALNAVRSNKRILYLVSLKALADQKFKDFQRRFGESAPTPISSVGLSTGDREEGDYAADILIATYEKALGLMLSGQLNIRNTVVIADELQIIGDRTRGPNIEMLCAALKQNKPFQFVGLTATISNAKDLAAWLDCKLIDCSIRNIPLHQEIWYQQKGFRTTFGQEGGIDLGDSKDYPQDVLEVVDLLIADGRAPILVFTESRREAKEYAQAYSKKRTRVADGIAVAEQLDLFSEPTEASESLRNSAERRVAFHTADLTPQERQVVEDGFVNAKFEVCFATSTLAAGVNFPFRSAVFPKLTYRWGDRQGTRIARSDYRNMSGRAGRLGLHEEGYSILLPVDRVELEHAKVLVSSENDTIDSQLVNLSMRRTVLTLFASRLANNRLTLETFFENTFYWHLLADKNRPMLDKVLQKAHDSVKWLVDFGMLEELQSEIRATPLGLATANAGLLPGTAAKFVELIAGQRDEFINRFDSLIPALFYWICTCDEFQGDTPSRFLPYASSPESLGYVGRLKLFVRPDRTNESVIHSVHALCLYVDGIQERQIAHSSGISSGYMHRLAAEASWVIDGLHRLSCVPELALPQQVSNNLAMLSKRVRWGSTPEALDILRIADRHSVPGFGRQRAMALVQNGLSTLDEILGAGKDALLGLLRSKVRVDALLAAVASTTGFGADRLLKSHIRIAKDLGLGELVEECSNSFGKDYELAVERLLGHEARWSITILDDGKAQNVPDILIKLGGVGILLECKTCTKSPSVINKEEAFAVLQKAIDYEPGLRRVTLGKPAFDEHSKRKAAAAKDITLVEHATFIEALLRVHSGSASPEGFLNWLGAPGVAEIARMSGIATYLDGMAK